MVGFLPLFVTSPRHHYTVACLRVFCTVVPRGSVARLQIPVRPPVFKSGPSGSPDGVPRNRRRRVCFSAGPVGPVAPKQAYFVTVTFFTASAVATFVVDNPFVLSTVHPSNHELVTALLFCEAVAVTVNLIDFEMFCR